MIELSIEKFNTLYWHKELAYRDVAKELGVSNNSLRSWIKKHRDNGLIKTRTRSEAISLANKNGKYGNKDGELNPNWKGGFSAHRCLSYGISIEEYDSMLHEQNGKCAICEETFSSTPNIDHCHSTGDVRGLLCRPCNQGLGHFRDNTYSLNKAIKYLNTKARWDSRA